MYTATTCDAPACDNITTIRKFVRNIWSVFPTNTKNDPYYIMDEDVWNKEIIRNHKYVLLVHPMGTTRCSTGTPTAYSLEFLVRNILMAKNSTGMRDIITRRKLTTTEIIRIHNTASKQNITVSTEEEGTCLYNSLDESVFSKFIRHHPYLLRNAVKSRNVPLLESWYSVDPLVLQTHLDIHGCTCLHVCIYEKDYAMCHEIIRIDPSIVWEHQGIFAHSPLSMVLEQCMKEDRQTDGNTHTHTGELRKLFLDIISVMAKSQNVPMLGHSEQVTVFLTDSSPLREEHVVLGSEGCSGFFGLPDDGIPPEDAIPPESTASPEDTIPPESTASPEDTIPPESTAPPPSPEEEDAAMGGGGEGDECMAPPLQDETFVSFVDNQPPEGYTMSLHLSMLCCMWIDAFRGGISWELFEPIWNMCKLPAMIDSARGHIFAEVCSTDSTEVFSKVVNYLDVREQHPMFSNEFRSKIQTKERFDILASKYGENFTKGKKFDGQMWWVPEQSMMENFRERRNFRSLMLFPTHVRKTLMDKYVSDDDFRHILVPFAYPPPSRTENTNYPNRLSTYANYSIYSFIHGNSRETCAKDFKLKASGHCKTLESFGWLPCTCTFEIIMRPKCVHDVSHGVFNPRRAYIEHMQSLGFFPSDYVQLCPDEVFVGATCHGSDTMFEDEHTQWDDFSGTVVDMVLIPDRPTLMFFVHCETEEERYGFEVIDTLGNAQFLCKIHGEEPCNDDCMGVCTLKFDGDHPSRQRHRPCGHDCAQDKPELPCLSCTDMMVSPEEYSYPSNHTDNCTDNYTDDMIGLENMETQEMEIDNNESRQEGSEMEEENEMGDEMEEEEMENEMEEEEDEIGDEMEEEDEMEDENTDNDVWSIVSYGSDISQDQMVIPKGYIREDKHEELERIIKLPIYSITLSS